MADPAWLPSPAAREQGRRVIESVTKALQRYFLANVSLRDRARAAGKMGLWKEATTGFRPWHVEHGGCGWHRRYQTHERAVLALREHGHGCWWLERKTAAR